MLAFVTLLVVVFGLVVALGASHLAVRWLLRATELPERHFTASCPRRQAN